MSETADGRRSEWLLLSSDQRALISKALLYGAVSITVIVMVFPLLWLMLSSIKPSEQLFATPPHLIPRAVTLENYLRVWNETSYPLYLRNSVVVALVTMVVTTVTATLAAYGLTRYDFRGRDVLANATLVVYLLPPIMLIVPLFVTFKFLGLNDTLVAVALGHITYSLPFSLWILRAFFESLPETFDEAAMCEGASRLQAMRLVVLPLALPGIMTVAIFSFTVSWNDYLFALTFISSDVNSTLTLATSQFAGSQAVSWDVLTAITVVIAIPPLLAIVFLKRHLLQGFGVAN